MKMAKNKKIYGVDPTKKVTPVKIRDAIIRCFLEAHDHVLQEMKEYHDFKSEKEFKRMKKLNIEIFIKNIFKDIEGDFNNPTKDDLIRVIDSLAEFSKNFRKPEVIKKHYNEIMTLINKL